MLKTYIKINLANNFIWPSNLPAGTLILFVEKPNDIFHLYVDYWGLNNFIIKNQYILLLIAKSLNQLSWINMFIQLNLTSAYYQIGIKEDNKWKTAFFISYSYFEYQVMRFRLSYTLMSFQDYINKFLAKEPDFFIIIYLDDIFVYIKDLG